VQRLTYEIEWTTITYRTIAIYTLLAAMLAGLVAYLVAPNYTTKALKKALIRASGGLVRSREVNFATTRQGAHFVNIEGSVRIRKAQSLEWTRASFNTNLEKGDLVQTGTDGVARIIFADGTSYTLKPDSLIVVEESREDPVTRATRVAVQVTSGAVNLSTGKFGVPGSTSQVAFEDAVASLAEESRAAVRNDPTRNVHEITLDRGQADVTRGSTSIRLGQYEQASFESGRAGLVKRKVIEPPTLLSPVNMALLVSQEPKATPIDFAWNEVEGADAYRLQVSASGMFSTLVIDRKVRQTSCRITGLEEGTYYWTVTSIDANGEESQPQMANRLNLVQQIGAADTAYLEVTRIIQHGKVLEVQGRTEPGSMVIINNEQVFSIAPDGTFRHFTSALLTSGSNQITITAQNRKGDTNTIRKTVILE